MKRFINLHLTGLFLVTMLLISCDNPLIHEQESASIADTGSRTPALSASAQISGGSLLFCGDASVTTLRAGQHMDSGTLTVTNDEENLYITFATSGDWFLQKTHLHVASALSGIPANRQGIPVPGQFRYSETHSFVTEYVYVLSLEDLGLDTGDSFVVAAHAEVVRIVDGEVVQSETAWGGDINGPGNRWWYYAAHVVQECIQGYEVPVCVNTETAWSAGDRYVVQGNWATYTSYSGELNTVTLFAGQTLNAGSVTFAPAAGGMVEISIVFATGWGLQDVAEAVKIQGYSDAPGGNPSPGQFNTYKGNDLVILVPEFAFYGVHVDAAQAVSCD